MSDYQTEYEKQLQYLCGRIEELEEKQEEILTLLTKLVDFLQDFSKIDSKKGVFHENGYSFNSNDCID